MKRWWTLNNSDIMSHFCGATPSCAVHICQQLAGLAFSVQLEHGPVVDGVQAQLGLAGGDTDYLGAADQGCDLRQSLGFGERTTSDIECAECG